MTHVVHWDDCEGRDRHAGDIHATWFDLGKLGSSDRVGLNRITIQPGRRSTPAHIHGAEEEIFHVLSGTGSAVAGRRGLRGRARRHRRPPGKRADAHAARRRPGA